MAKTFAPRAPKGERRLADPAGALPGDLLRRLGRDGPPRGMDVEDVPLSAIDPPAAGRGPLGGRALEALAEDIRRNGLMEPLLVHREGRRFALVRGERRLAALASIGAASAPCLVLAGRTAAELLALRFSEGASREGPHYVDVSEGLLAYRRATGASEREAARALGMSKSEAHRAMVVAGMPPPVKEAARRHGIEKYVLLDLGRLPEGPLRREAERRMLAGLLRSRDELRDLVRRGEGPPGPPPS